jgi:ABC-type glycerol-3-phosphate transport system permease component
MSSERRFSGKLVLLILCLAIAALSLFPTLWMFATSLKPDPLIPTWPPKWYAGVVTLANYLNVFTGYPFLYWLRNSVAVSLISTALTIFLGSLAGYAFARFKFRGKNLLFLLAVATIIIPQEITIIPLYISMTKIGIANTYLSLILPLVANPVSIFLFKQFFDGFPIELEEAAFLDGLGRFNIYSRLVMPLSTAVIMAVAILTFTAAWNDMLWPTIITSTVKAATLPVGVVQHFEMFQGAKVVRYGDQSAVSILCLVPTVIVFIILQKYFIQGIARTGLKG